MFGKKHSGIPTVIGPDATFEGQLKIDGELRIEGRIVGSVFSEGDVSIGPDGSVDGDLTARNVAVAGRVEGHITVREHLHMLPTGIVRGEASYATLQVDRGGVIDGRAAREEDSRSVAAASSNRDENHSSQPKLASAG